MIESIHRHMPLNSSFALITTLILSFLCILGQSSSLSTFHYFYDSLDSLGSYLAKGLIDNPMQTSTPIDQHVPFTLK